MTIEMIEKNNIETDLNIGKAIFENVPDSLKPYWSGLILSTFNNYIKEIPKSVRELHSIIDDKSLKPSQVALRSIAKLASSIEL